MQIDYDTLVRHANTIDDLLDIIDDHAPLLITSKLHIQTVINETIKEVVSTTYYNIYQQLTKILNGFGDNPQLLLEELHDLNRVLEMYGMPQVIDGLQEWHKGG